MATKNSDTKVKRTNKDYMLRARMDNESLQKLDDICAIREITRSEFVRQSIDKEYRKIKR